MSSELYEAVADGAALLTVNRRLARHHAHRYARRCAVHGGAGATAAARGEARLPSPAPLILPWRAWLEAVHDEALAEGLSTLARAQPIVARRLWRRALGSDAATALLDPDAAAAEAERAWRLGCAWRCADDGEEWLSHDQRVWRRWRGRYLARRDAEGLVDEATLADHLAELLATHGAAALALPERVLLAGFLRIDPQQRELLDALAAAGVAVEELEGQGPGAVRVDRHADEAAELRQVAAEARRLLAARPEVSLGVVVPDLGERRAAVLRAFDRAFFPGLTPAEIAARGRPYDLSLGLPLAERAVVRSALALLRLTVSRVGGGELSALLMSPYLAGGAGESRRREALDRRLRERRVRAIGLAALARELGGTSRLGRAARALERRLDRRRALPSVWATRFAEALRTLGWPGEGLDSEEYQGVRAWQGCVADLALLDDGERVGGREALALLARLARERVFQPETPALPIQVMGRLESHGIAVDRLWVTGLDDERWPPAGSPSPFLPIARQKAAGVPEASVEARLALAERELALWRASARELVASRVAERDGNALDDAAVLAELAADAVARFADDPAAPAGPSRPAFGTGADDDPVGLVDPVAVVARAARLERVVDEMGPPLPAGTELGGGARLFEDQARCPFRAFARHRLHVRPLEEGGLGLDPRAHGNLLHRALELFWRETGSHAALVALDEDALGARLDAAVEETLAEGGIDGPLRALEARRLRRLLDDWIELCERPREPFEVVAFEEAVEIEHGGIRTRVKPDRIDRVGDAHVVIDYKSGSRSSIASWSEPRIVDPQLPLYAVTDARIAGASFARVVRHRTGFAGVASDAGLLPQATLARDGIEDWDGWRAHWGEALGAIAEEIRAGVACATPIRDACRHCELAPLCRIESGAAPGAEEPAADAGDGER